MENQQPEALVLASLFERCVIAFGETETSSRAIAAKELRRLHTRVEELEAMLDAVGAGGVSAQRIRQESDHIAQDSKMVSAPVVLPEPFTALVRKKSWLRGAYDAAPCAIYKDYGRKWADERVFVYTEQQVRELLDKATCTKSQIQEPFGYFKAEPFGWRDCAETDEGAIALYEAPQPQADALDTERLDWLIEQGCSNGVVHEGLDKIFWMVWLDGHDAHKDKYQIGRYHTAREAIDAAIAAEKGE